MNALVPLSGSDSQAAPAHNRLVALAAEIRSLHAGIQRNLEQVAQDLFEAGKLLIEAKKSLPHGQWGAWLRDHVIIPPRTASRYMRIAKSGLEIGHVADLGVKAVDQLIAIEASRTKREASRAALPITDGMELRIGDCRVALSDIPDNSVPLILTDPPYGDDAEPLYRWLAQFAARVLIPGGSLICYTGQARLNRDFRILDEHLTYLWQATMLHGPAQRLFGAGILVNHKPILWYVKEFRRGRTLVPDVVRSVYDKSQHAWAQGDGGVWQWIEQLTEPGELIVDPFAGTATWGHIAHSLGRRWIGCDLVQGGTTTIQAEVQEAA